MRIDDMDDFDRLINELMNSFFSGGYKRQSIQKRQEEINENTIDKTEDETHVYITIELRGIAEEDLSVIPEEYQLVLELMYHGKWIRRTVQLPYKVNPKTAKISFKNCILDVILEKVLEDVKESSI